MNKLFSKIASLSVGLAMAVGVGVALGHESVKEVKAATTDTYHEVSLAADKEVLIVGKNATGYFAMGSAGGTSSAPAAIAATVSNSSLSSTTDLASHVWVVSGDSSGWTFTKKDTTNKLYCTNSNNGVRVGTNSNNQFTISSEGYLKNSATSRYVGIYNSSDWRCYTSINNNITGQEFTFWEVDASGQDTLVVKLNDATVSPLSLPWSATDRWLFYANDKDDNDINANWTSSDEKVFTVEKNGNNVAVVTPVNPGTANLVASADGFDDGVFVLTVTAGTLESIEVTGSMSKTSYYVGETWSPTGLVATGTYDTGYVGDISSEVEWSYSPATPAMSVTSVVATATIGTVSGNSSAQAVTVSKTNQIQVLYGLASGASVDVYGYYVGFLDGTGPVIMDGEYGIVIYSKSADVSEYTEKVTILHVTGSISIYNGLYEIGSASISVASSVPEDNVPSTPVVYAAKGGESAEYASRLTTVTGTATVTSGSFDDAAGTKDIKMNFSVGTQTVQVFYKKAAQTADAEAFAAMKAAVADSTEITIKGFTGWYNGFQVQMNGYVPAAEGYTAEQFAQDLLDQTDAVCTGWKEGDNNHDALVAIWSNLAANDKYPSLPSDQKTILAEAERDESGTVVEQAMARYDFLTGKYGLSNFINGRTPVESNFNFNVGNENNSYIIIVVISAVSVMSFGLALFLRKKRSK